MKCCYRRITILSIQEATKKVEAIRAEEGKRELTFFVGLYSELDTQDRTDLSDVLKLKDSNLMTAGIRRVQLRLANRLKLDKESLRSWVLSNGLSDQVEILDKPENNYFVLFRAPSAIISKLLCAIEAQELPQVFSDLGYKRN